MAYNNHEMKRIILPSLLACLLATAFLSCSMEPGLYGKLCARRVEGTLYIDLPDTVPYDFQKSGLLGTVQIIIGKQYTPCILDYIL